MYKIQWANIGHGPAQSFASIDAAVAYAKEKGFEAVILQNGYPVAAWGILSGVRHF